MTSPLPAAGADAGPSAHGQDEAAGPPEGVQPIDRAAARVLLVDALDRVLLLRGFDPTAPARGRYWMTVGGGIDAGESSVQAAARELHEETGLRVDPGALGEPVFDEVAVFGFEGRWYRQTQAFYLLRVDSWDVSPRHLTAVELRSVDRHRWWSIAELESTRERVYPAELPALLRRLCASGEDG